MARIYFVALFSIRENMWNGITTGKDKHTSYNIINGAPAPEVWYTASITDKYNGVSHTWGKEYESTEPSDVPYDADAIKDYTKKVVSEFPGIDHTLWTWGKIKDM